MLLRRRHAKRTRPSVVLLDEQILQLEAEDLSQAQTDAVLAAWQPLLELHVRAIGLALRQIGGPGVTLAIT